jgi:hypothetical protein
MKLTSNKLFLYWTLLLLSIGVFTAIRWIWKTSLIFEQTIMVFLITTLIIFLICKVWKNNLDYERIILVNFVVFILIQFLSLNIDRSRSFYMLKWSAQNRVVLEDNRIIGIIDSSDTFELEGLEQRLVELEKRKLIKRQESLLKTTTLGNIVYAISNSIALVWNLGGWRSA